MVGVKCSQRLVWASVVDGSLAPTPTTSSGRLCGAIMVASCISTEAKRFIAHSGGKLNLTPITPISCT